MKHPSDFFNFLINAVPILPGNYNYLAKVKDDDSEFYLNLGVSPIYRDFVTTPFKMDVNIGDHVFISQTTAPVYLVDYYNMRCGEFAIGEDQLKHTKAEDQVEQVIFYPKFALEIESEFKYKIEQGRLYLRKDDEWVDPTLIL